MKHASGTGHILAASIAIGCATSSGSQREVGEFYTVCPDAKAEGESSICGISGRDIKDLVKAYYENESEQAGEYKIRVLKHIVERDGSGWNVHVGYRYDAANSDRTRTDRSGIDNRVFRFKRSDQKVWIVAMSGPRTGKANISGSPGALEGADDAALSRKLAEIAASDAAEQVRRAAPRPAEPAGASCHRLVADASNAEAKERARGRKTLSDSTRKKMRAATICLKSEAGAVLARDGHGATPLHVAAHFGGVGMTKILLELGADRDIRDTSGNTPADHAAGAGHPKVVELLTGVASQIDWSIGRELPERPTVTDNGSNLIRLWLGEVIRYCTIDGELPRTDHANTRAVVKMTWGSKYAPCEQKVLFFKHDELKDASFRSLAMYECDEWEEQEKQRCQP